MTESFMCKMRTEITQTLVYHVVVGLKIFTFYVTIIHESPFLYLSTWIIFSCLCSYGDWSL